MTIELLRKLNEIGFFKYVAEISDDEEIGEVDDSDLEKSANDNIVQLGLSGLINEFFREKYNLLGNVYSNASGFLFEAHDSQGGTHRIDSGLKGDDENSGTFTTYNLAQCALYNAIIEYKSK